MQSDIIFYNDIKSTLSNLNWILCHVWIIFWQRLMTKLRHTLANDFHDT